MEAQDRGPRANLRFPFHEISTPPAIQRTGLFNPIFLIERPLAKKPPCGGFGGKWEKGRVGLCRIDQAPVFDDEPAIFDDVFDGIDSQMIDQEEIVGDLAQDEIHLLPDL